jgi:hypothetical protein
MAEEPRCSGGYRGGATGPEGGPLRLHSGRRSRCAVGVGAIDVAPVLALDGRDLLEVRQAQVGRPQAVEEQLADILRQFLETVVKESGAKSVSIIAHGVGTQPLMNAESARASAEQQRLAEISSAQAERERALKAAEIAQQEKAEASRRLVRRTVTGSLPRSSWRS